MSLADFYSSMTEQEEEMEKLAAEEDAAGRIMARGFMDELNKLAADPFASLDAHMKQKGIKAPAALKAKTKVTPTVKPVAQPSRKKILGGAQMGMQQVAPGSAQAKAIARKAKTVKPTVSAGEQGRQAARAQYLKNKRIMEQQQQERY